MSISEVQYPVRAEGPNDPRFASLARDVGRVLEQHGFPRVNGEAREELEQLLYEFCYVPRQLAADLARGSITPGRPSPPQTFTVEGPLCSEDCIASAHELREVKGANGALVIAMDDDDVLHCGCSVEAGSKMDIVSARLLAKLDDMAPGDGTSIKDVVLSVVIKDDGAGGRS
jgi:hypothetical protein